MPPRSFCPRRARQPITRATVALLATFAFGSTPTAQESSADTPPDARPVITASRDGFSARSADGAFQLRVRGYVQVDSRSFLNDERPSTTNGFLLRRVRPILEATLYKHLDVRVMPDFGGGTTALFDAYLDMRIRPELAIRLGKFKSPLGLERLRSSQDILFVERGLPTNLVPARDVGLQVSGDLREGIVNYTAGVFNGAPDLASGDADNNDAKDLAGRILLKPFRAQKASPLTGWVFGLAGSRGTHRGASGAASLPGYRAPSQQAVFAYRGDAFADGTHTRLSPQGYWYFKRVGVLAEYVRSSQAVRRGTATANLSHSSYGVEMNYVLTGEASGFRGVTPKQPFDPDHHAWGAFELGFRFGRLAIDEAAFPLFADAATAVRRESSWGAAANWYLARGMRVMVDYDRTSFVGGDLTGDRNTEHVIMTRVQYAF